MTNAKNRIYPFFLAMRGCEYRCIYCDQRRTASSENVPGPDEVTEALNNEIIPPGPWTVAFYGGTFTGLERELQKQYCDAVWASRRAGLITAIRISTRPDAMDDSDVAFLAVNGIRTVELGIQSFDDAVLAAAGRGYSGAVAAAAAQLVRGVGLRLGIQLMSGLPGEDEGSWRRSVAATVAAAPDFVRLYPTLVVKGTPLAETCRSGEYRPLSLEDAALRCAYAIERFYEAGISIERVGLQETAGLSHEIIAGPHHPAFGEIAYSYLMRKRIEEVIGEMRNGVKVAVAPDMVSAAIGHKRMNMGYFYDKYGISIKIVPDDGLSNYKVGVTPAIN